MILHNSYNFRYIATFLNSYTHLDKYYELITSLKDQPQKNQTGKG